MKNFVSVGRPVPTLLAVLAVFTCAIVAGALAPSAKADDPPSTTSLGDATSSPFAGFPSSFSQTGSSDDTTAPALADFSLSPSTIDTSTGAQTITVTARITDADSGLGSYSSSVSFRSPSGQSVYASFDSTRRISGTANDGVYRTTMTVPQYSAQGTWTVSSFYLSDVVGNGRQVTVADLTNAGFPSSFSQTGSSDDTTAPALADFSLSPSTIDTSTGAQTITVTARITDADSGLGSYSSSVSFRSPSGQSVYASFDSTRRISGTANDGVYRTTMTVPQYSAQGTWTVSSFYLSDVVGNGRQVTVADLTNAGFPSSFSQTGSSDDTTAPALADFSLSPSTIDTSTGAQTITVTARITDADSGLGSYSSSVSFRSPSGQSVYASFDSTRRISGTANDGVYRTTMTVPQYSAQGTWTVSSFYLSDVVGNGRQVTVADLTNAGFPSAFQNTAVDTVPPETSITAGPSGPTTSSSPSFSFGSEAGATFECRLDAGPWASCTSPKSYTALAEGSHTFEVRARDAAGNTDATPATRTFTIDTIAPETSITAGPSGTTTSSSPSFSFGSETGATFECRLDADPWASCTSPKSYTALAEGSHTFEVRARDAAGNTDATPATRTFAVDTQTGGADTTAPALADFSLSPTTIDTSAGSQKVTLTARITDTGAGLGSFGGSVSFRGPNNQTVYAGLSESQRISGSANDGVYRTEITVPQYSAKGTFTLFSFSLQDAVGNSRQITVADLTNAGFPSSFSQTGENADTTAPALADFSLSPTTIDTSAGSQKVTLTARITDTGAGLGSLGGSVSFRGPNNQTVYAGLSESQRISGSANDGVYRTEITVPQYSAKGTFTLFSFSLQDAVGNSRQITVADLTNAGFPSSFSQTGENADTTAPALADFSLSPTTIDTSAGSQKVTLTARITDTGAGLGSFGGSVSFRGPNNQTVYAGLSESQRISGSANDGVYRTEITVPQYSAKGTFTLFSFSLQDAVGNSRQITVADLTNAGFPSSFTVASGNPAPTPTPTPTPAPPNPTPTPTPPPRPGDGGTGGREGDGSGTGGNAPAPPAGPIGASINGGARYTNNPHVNVSVVWPLGASTVLLSNDGGFKAASAFPVVGSIPWTLESSGPERLPKTVYVRFGADSQTFTDDIVLDETAPKITSAKVSGWTGTGRATAAQARKVSLTVNAADTVSGVARIQVTTNRRRPGQFHKFARRISVKQAARVWVRVSDGAGNLSGWRNATARRSR